MDSLHYIQFTKSITTISDNDINIFKQAFVHSSADTKVTMCVISRHSLLSQRSVQMGRLGTQKSFRSSRPGSRKTRNIPSVITFNKQNMDSRYSCNVNHSNHNAIHQNGVIHSNSINIHSEQNIERSNSSVRLFLINNQSIRNNSVTLLKYIREKDCDLCVISES